MQADAYDEILNDHVTAIKYAKKAYENDSKKYRNAEKYLMVFTITDVYRQAVITDIIGKNM